MARQRKLICNARFQKFSLQKKLEDGTQKISLPIKVPSDDMEPDTAAELLHKSHVRMEISRRAIGEWRHADLPGVEDQSTTRIIECETDIMACTWRAGYWNFSFLIDTSILSINEANEIWNCGGSCRLTLLGKAIETDDEDEDEDAPANEPKKRGRPRKEDSHQKTLV